MRMRDEKANDQCRTITAMDIEDGRKRTAEKNSQTEIGMLHGIMYLMLFLLLGPTLIMINKTILKDIGFSFPITHTFYTSLFCACSVWLGVHVFGLELRHKNMVTREFYINNVLPIGFLQGATVVLGMTSYLFLTVSFVQMLKASTPVMIVIFLNSCGIESSSVRVVASVLVISFGTVLSGYGEMNLNILGVTSMLSAQVCEALRLVLTQKLLKNFKFDVLEGLYYVTPAASFWVFIAALIFEIPRMTADTMSMIFSNASLFLIAGVLALGVNFINSLVIKVTGSLMMKLLATARNASLVIFNVVIMAEPVTMVQFCGYSISLAGFVGYNYFRIKKA